MYAAAFGHREIVLLILAAFRQLHHVAFQGQRNGQGLTAWQLAERNGHEDIAALLKVETGVFPRPSGPSTFVPAHPLDLDRPPTPTETRSIRSSVRRSRSRGQVTASGPGPTDPLPPPPQVAPHGRRRCSRSPSEAASLRRGRRECACSQVGDTDEEESFPLRNVRDSGDARKPASGASGVLVGTKGEAGDRPSRSAKGLAGVGWTRNTDDATAESQRAQGEKWPARGEPLRIGAADADERPVLEELMQSLSCSPGSGNEGDTESLMECERPSAEYDQAFVRMSVGSGRKVASSSQPMPKIGLCSSTRSLNRSIQHLVQEDVENRPEHRPPTPARPSLPTLLPGRLLDVSLSASVGSTKSEGRVPSQPRRAAFAAFPRSSSEPRSLAASPRPQQDADEDAGEDAPGDLLDASTRSEGWDHLRGSRGRGPAAPSEGHVVPLPPINRPRYSEAGGKGRSSVRGRGAAAAGGAAAEENVLSVAKKTLEQLETVLAPKEATAALPRTIPRTRTGHQIHLET